ERRTRRPRPGRTGDSPLDRAGPGGRSATAPRGGVEWSTGTRRDVLLRSGRWRSWPAPHVDGFVPDLVDGERIAPAGFEADEFRVEGYRFLHLSLQGPASGRY